MNVIINDYRSNIKLVHCQNFTHTLDLIYQLYYQKMNKTHDFLFRLWNFMGCWIAVECNSNVYFHVSLNALTLRSLHFYVCRGCYYELSFFTSTSCVCQKCFAFTRQFIAKYSSITHLSGNHEGIVESLEIWAFFLPFLEGNIFHRDEVLRELTLIATLCINSQLAKCKIEKYF